MEVSCMVRKYSSQSQRFLKETDSDKYRKIMSYCQKGPITPKQCTWFSTVHSISTETDGKTL